MEKVLSTQSIIDLFSDAIKTDRKLPPEYKNNLKTMKFDVVNDKTEHNAWDKRPLRIAANSKDIARYEFVLFVLNPRLEIIGPAIKPVIFISISFDIFEFDIFSILFFIILE